MPVDPIPACFRGGGAAPSPPSTAAGPSLTTSVYETRLGLAGLTWSRTVLGLSVRADLHLLPSPLPHPDPAGSDSESDPLRFRIRPWLFWKRRGHKRFHPKSNFHTVDFAWDLTRARFPAGGGPEPCGGFFLAVIIDGEMLLVAGDLTEEAQRRTRSIAKVNMVMISRPVLVSRREHVVLGDGGRSSAYKTAARFGGKEREISIELGAGERKERGEVGMWVGVDGKRVLHVRRLRWKFRGSERVEVEAGTKIQVSWDLHNWLFQPRDDDGGGGGATAASAVGAPPEMGHAVFVFRFEAGEESRGYFGKSEERQRSYSGNLGMIGGYFGKKGSNGNWSERSFSSGGGGAGRGEKKSGRKNKSLLMKTSSSSSSSSASSAGSSTVMEWASQEEAELRGGQGFSLLVYAWKS